MFNKNLFIAVIAMLMIAFVGSASAQDIITTKITKTPKPNLEGATNQKPKNNRVASKGGSGRQEVSNAGDHNANKRTTSGNKSERSTKGTKTNQVTGGTIPVYKNGKNTTKRKKTPVKNSFESQTQPFADGKVKGKNDPEAKPALLEFQIPEKVVSDNKHPEGQYSRKEADSRKSNQKPKRANVKKSNGIIILDQDTQTVVAPRKRKRNK